MASGGAKADGARAPGADRRHCVQVENMSGLTRESKSASESKNVSKVHGTHDKLINYSPG